MLAYWGALAETAVCGPTCTGGVGAGRTNPPGYPICDLFLRCLIRKEKRVERHRTMMSERCGKPHYCIAARPDASELGLEPILGLGRMPSTHRHPMTPPGRRQYPDIFFLPERAGIRICRGFAAISLVPLFGGVP